ncbi:protein-binding activity modulator [Lithospermum erythrorhizon]|uniref:Protein-binding activity modulator n=1 Tax=Lithospermum erythrorhizon TaxID=34254 RepID=A0AAV3PSF0_LITER
MEKAEDSKSKSTLINSFCEITSCSQSEALFFLESHNFDLDSAVSTFLETTTNIAAVEEEEDVNRKSSGGGSDSDPDYEPEYYSGGQKSGMVVQDGPKANDGDAIFTAVRNSGAVDASGEHSRPSSSSRSFSGTARLLSGDTVVPAPQQSEQRNHHIALWNDGFTVNDGPFRRLDDPQNAPFLESISRGECPDELRSSAKRGDGIKVSLSRKEENYPISATRQPTSFLGVGRTLTTSSSNITSTTEPSAPAANSITASPSPMMGLVVDQTLPTTSIQLRLADGTRMVSRFNFHHTINDIRGFIDASRPGGSLSYQLQTVGFPPKQLTELGQTIEQAGLANSVVIQKLG